MNLLLRPRVKFSPFLLAPPPPSPNSRVPARVCEVESEAVCSKNSTFDYFDETAWTPRMRPPSPIMTPGPVKFMPLLTIMIALILATDK